MSDATTEGSRWLKVLEPEELAEGRVKPVTCGHRTLCMTRFEGRYGALDNACPHQGGPLGEGSIENGLLRCPWHGWDYDPISGKAPGYDDGVETFPVEEREDGVYVELPRDPPHEATAADLIAQTLVNWEVTNVFGMVGHSNLGMADAFRRQAEMGNLRYIGIRHEGAASFACSAYGKLTGHPAICFSIAGPGATNLLTGLWDANVDRSPVIAVTGQVDTQVLGPGAFQEVDLQAAFGKVAQWSQTVLHSSRFAELANLACKSAILNRGVSHLIFPNEVQNLPWPPDGKPGGHEGRVPYRQIEPPVAALHDAIEALAGAERPVIIVGHGARFQMEHVIDFAESFGIPVITTFKAKGQISDHHRLGGGVLGRSGTPIASWLMNESDLLLVLGASFSNHTGITPKKTTIQVDYDPMQLARFHAIDVPVWGEIGATMTLLKGALEDRMTNEDRTEDVAARWEIWRAEKARREAEEGENGVGSAAIFAAMNRTVPEDAILPVDVGNNTYSFGRYFECARQAVLMSGYLGSIGFALPAALGAWVATQEDDPLFAGRKVVSVSGDGGFAQYMGELTTAVKYGMDIAHVLLHNRELGKISKEQRAGSWDVWETSLHNPNFARYAANCGALGIRVSERGELDEALERAIGHDGPALVEIMADPLLV
ncbi:MAG: thiamine pyrophosphate-binding protein [Gemmatimonadota bacterium]|nr:thiamine pyrophosphate-binding protein [Gemmatimonadota bacterium]